jgi:maltooligosyltrehalose trehalohydrolase
MTVSERCGAVGRPDGSVRWRVWAPKVRRVELVLFDGGRRRALAMQPHGQGFFVHTEGGVADGQRYAYRLDNGPERPDPATLWQPDGIHAPSAVLFPGRFAWSEDGWRGVPRADLVLYELHVGTFTPAGTFDAVIPRLPALRDLGVTAVELMPVAQFPGPRNWGYDGVHPYAPQNSYGGPHGLQRLVDACHAAGLAVFLDVVYNHLGPEGNYLHEFGPYFTDRHRTPWGPAFNYDGPDAAAVRAFVLDNVRLWVEDYRLDGLRLDATHAMHDAGPVHILRAVKETADAAAARLGRHACIIAESLLNDVRILRPPAESGYGLDAEWNDDFHHAIHAHLTGERQGQYADFGRVADFPKLLERTFLLDGGHSVYRGRPHGAPAGDLAGDRFVVSVQDHDHVGNRARGDRLAALVAAPARRLAASLLLLAPHLPLLFMGEEYGEDHPFLFFCSFGSHRLVERVRQGRRRDYAAFMQGEIPDPQAESSFAASRLSWSWPEGSPRAGLRRLYADLLAARRTWPALRDFVHRSARLLPDPQAGPVLELVRGTGPDPGESVQVLCNLDGRAQPLPPGLARGPRLLFSSEAECYHGGRRDGTPVDSLLAHECVVLGAGAGAGGSPRE